VDHLGSDKLDPDPVGADFRSDKRALLTFTKAVTLPALDTKLSKERIRSSVERLIAVVAGECIVCNTPGALPAMEVAVNDKMIQTVPAGFARSNSPQ
jgi:hypothetical protein